MLFISGGLLTLKWGCESNQNHIGQCKVNQNQLMYVQRNSGARKWGDCIIQLDNIDYNKTLNCH